MSERWCVAVTDPMHPEPTGRLEAFADVIVLKDSPEPREALIAKADALIVRTPISEADVRAGARLKLIVRHGAGLDFIPVAFALERGIRVASVPDANSVSVAEYVIGAMLALARSFVQLDRQLRAGDWAVRQRLPGFELAYRTLGIVGVGRIGRLVAARAHHGLGMAVVGFDPHQRSFPDHVKRAADLDSLLAESDVVTLHVPLAPETAGLLDAPRLRRMKHGSFLINAARGGIVDELALAAALNDGHLAGAALDVYSTHPIQPDHPLLAAPNALLTPHAASLTAASFRAMGAGSVEEVERAWRGVPLLNPVHG
jgi:D-3-phosphoglycerate dehydrogenase / 2-oxoglutarate reductase